MKTWDKQRLGLLLAIGSAITYGFWPSGVRGAYANGANVAFILLASTWLRAVSMTGFCLLTRKHLFHKRSDIWQAISGGFFQAVSMVTLYVALEYLPGPLVIIILFSHTLMLLMYMIWKREITANAFTILTTIIALAGLTLVLDIWHAQSHSNWIGIGLAFVAALATVSRLYVFGHQTKERHPIVVGAEVYIAAGIFSFFILAYQMPRLPDTVAGYEYAALACVAGAAATFAMFYGIAFLGSFKWSLFLKLEPVFTSLFAALLLGEILKPMQYLGIFVVISSLITYQIVEHRRKMVATKLAEAPIQ